METVLVTGGAGFIGSTLSEKLLNNGNRVVCLDNFDPYYSPETKRKNLANCLKNNNFTLIEADIRDPEKLRLVFEKESFGKIVHLAALAGVRHSIEDPLAFEESNVRGLLNVLGLAKDFGIKNFVFASSSSIYGVSKKIPFQENDIGIPISPYGITKRAGELYCRQYSQLYDLNVSCLRFFTVYGPRQRPDMAIHKFTRLIDGGKTVPVYSNGKSQRDFTFIDDIVNGICSAIENPFEFEIFNLGNGRTIELNALVSLIGRELGKEAKVELLPDQPGDVPITYADISKAKKMLGYEPKTGIEEGVKKFVEWYKGNK